MASKKNSPRSLVSFPFEQWQHSPRKKYSHLLKGLRNDRYYSVQDIAERAEDVKKAKATLKRFMIRNIPLSVALLHPEDGNKPFRIKGKVWKLYYLYGQVLSENDLALLERENALADYDESP